LQEFRRKVFQGDLATVISVDPCVMVAVQAGNLMKSSLKRLFDNKRDKISLKPLGHMVVKER
jgi:hypothetical protein